MNKNRRKEEDSSIATSKIVWRAPMLDGGIHHIEAAALYAASQQFKIIEHDTPFTKDDVAMILSNLAYFKLQATGMNHEEIVAAFNTGLKKVD